MPLVFPAYTSARRRHALVLLAILLTLPLVGGCWPFQTDETSQPTAVPGATGTPEAVRPVASDVLNIAGET